MTKFFNETKRQEHMAYHKVNRRDLKFRTSAVAKLAAEELTERVNFSEKYYRGTYDRRHLSFMQELYQPVKSNLSALIDMPLSTLVTLSRAGIRN